MRLESVQIQRFRCIDDSTEFTVSDQTCLVGKNESGKTAILKALYRLKPEQGSKEVYSPAEDHPKKSWMPGAKISKHPPIVSTKWTLSDENVVELEEHFGKGAIADRSVVIKKGYDNMSIVDINVNEAAVVAHLLKSKGLAEDGVLSSPKICTIEALKTALGTIVSDTQTDNHKLLAKTLSEDFKRTGTLPIVDAVWGLVPNFLYFNQYHQVDGQISINQLLDRKNNNTQTHNDRIFLALLELAGTTPEEIRGAATFEEFNSKLRAVSNRITDKIFQYWSQNRHLEVMIKFGQGMANDPTPFNTGEVCRVRIDNKRHRADTSFNDRSTGFVWFFSFLVWFDHVKRENPNLILLLDEPGLSLHARAQADLLRYFKEELSEYQLIYTTHSPFMIDPDRILDCRTVEDVVEKKKVGKNEVVETPIGTKVGSRVLSTDEDTVSPLQRCLDYEITQTLFIGRHTLLVEGPSDLLYMKWFSRQLEKANREGLDYRWTICEIKGVDRIAGFISLFKGNSLNIASLIDVHTGDGQKIKNAQAAIGDGRLLLASELSGRRTADIEDILGWDFFTSLVNKAYRLNGTDALPTVRPAGEERTVMEVVEEKFRVLPAYVREFDHYFQSDQLFQEEIKGTELPGFDAALDRFEAMFKKFNALLPSLK
jgi:energy-coupling factor transporter ATP-binding protein EcfA2